MVVGRYILAVAMLDGRASGGRSQLGQAARRERPLYAVLRQLFLITDVIWPNPECNELTQNRPLCLLVVRFRF